MAKCFDVVGYVEPCNAVRQKYTGRALLITGVTTEPYDITFSENGLIVANIKGDVSFDTLVGELTRIGAKVLPISVSVENPFGVTIQGNTDSGRVMYTKTIPVSIPATRDGKAEEFIMGLQKGLYQKSIIVLETNNVQIEDSSYSDIFGVYSPIRIDPASVTRSEYENGGAWQFNLVCEDPVPNVICTMKNLGVALDTLNA